MERVLESGLVGGHAYTLTGIRKVGGTSPSVSPRAFPSLSGLLTKALVSIISYAQSRGPILYLLKQGLCSLHLCTCVLE